MQGRGGKEQIALRYYVVRIKRLGDILIKASSAEEAAKMAMQFDSDSWGNFKMHVEAPVMKRIRMARISKSKA